MTSPTLADGYAGMRDKHLAEMADWVEGRRSWTNLGLHEPYTPDVIAVMDAQEVVKHAAAAQTYGILAAAEKLRGSNERH